MLRWIGEPELIRADLGSNYPRLMIRRWRYEETVLLLVVVANIAQLGARLVISPTVPEMIDAFEVTKSQIGLALTGMWAAYAIFQFPGGVFASRFGERRMLLVSMGIVGVASLLLSRSPTFFSFGVFVVLLGAGGALFFPAAGPLLSKLYENTGMAFGVVTAGAAIAGLVGPAVAGIVTTRFGWRVVPLLGAAAGLTTLGLVTYWIRPTVPNDPSLSLVNELRPGNRQFEILSRPPVAFSIAVAVAGAFTFQAFTSFFPTFLVEFHDYSVQRAGIAFGGVFLLSAFSQPVVGRLSDTFSRDIVIAAVMVITANGFALVLLASRAAPRLFAFGLLGVGISWFGVINARFMDALGDDERNFGFGLIRTVALLLGAAGSVITGTVADIAGWWAAFGLVVGLLLTACVLLALNTVFDFGL